MLIVVLRTSRGLGDERSSQTDEVPADKGETDQLQSVEKQVECG